MDRFAQYASEMKDSLKDEIPEQFQDSVIDWIYGAFGITWRVAPTLQLHVSSDRIFVQVDCFDDDKKYLLMVDEDRAQTCFWIYGTVSHVHLSRTKRSVIVKTEEELYLWGEPYIDFTSKRYIVALTGEIRE